MNRILLTLSLLLLISGCSSTSLVSSRGDDPRLDRIGYDRFRKQVEGKTLTVVLKNGRQYTARDVLVKQDSTTFIDEDNDLGRSLPTPEIRRFEYQNRLGGALVGLFLGIGSGGLVGYAVSTTIPGGDQRGLGVFYAVFGGASLGGVCGLLFGVTAGDLHEYEIIEESSVDSVDSTGAP